MSHSQGRGVAAIVSAVNGSANGLLTDFARTLRASGWRVKGLVQDSTFDVGTHQRQMALVDLDDGRRFSISQNLGPGSRSCCIDPGGVSAASAALRRALTEGADLVIANRFGELEAGGSGLASEMLALMADGIPLLTVVGNRYLENWRRFTGNAADELPAHVEALANWFGNLYPDKHHS